MCWFNDGIRRHVLVSARAIKSSGETKVFSMTVDISEQEKAQQALEESERRFTNIFKLSPEIISISRVADGCYLDVNDAFEHVLGYAREETIGHTSNEMGIWTNPNDRDEMVKILKERGVLNQHEIRLYHKDRRVVIVLFSAVIVKEKNEELLLSIALDITERKKQEEELKKREMFFEKQAELLFALMKERIALEGNVNQAARIITEACASIIDSERVSIWLYTDDYSSIRCIDLFEKSQNRHSTGEELHSADFPTYTATHREGKVVVAVDVYSDPYTREIPKDYFDKYRIVSLIDAPVWIQNRIGGLLSVEHVGEQRSWSAEDERLTTMMATLLSLCFETDERKRAKETLAESELKFRAIFENAGDAIFIMDGNTFVDCNSKTLEIFRVSREEILGRRPFDYSPELQLDGMSSAAKAAEKIEMAYSGKSQFFEWIHLRGDGTCFLAEINLACIIINGKRHLQAIVRDISERKAAENALRVSEANLQAIMANTTDIIASYDCERRLVAYNQACSETFRKFLGVEIYPGFRPIELFPESVRASWNKNCERVLAGESFMVEFEMPYSEDAWRVLESSYHPIWQGAEVVGFSTTTRDITTRKQAEKERSKLQTQLIQAQKMESVGRLAGGVAHDFNNMLGVIIGRAEMALSRVNRDSRAADDLEEILKAAKYSSDLTRQLLAFARRQAINPRVVDLNAIVEGMLKMLRRLIGEDIKLEWKPGALLWAVKMDSTQIDQLLANLLVNARDAISGAGQVIIETANVVVDESYGKRHLDCNPGDYVCLIVADSGRGMSKDALEHLFEPFFTTKEQGKGTGLGLAMVYGIVKQNNGFVSVYSEPECGTIFRIYFPRDLSVLVEETQELEKEDLYGSATVLLVEDESIVCNLSKEILEEYGYSVFAFSSACESIEFAQHYESKIHLLITDVVMPDMNGKVLAEKIALTCPDIKVLFMSGYTSDIIAYHGVLEEGIHFVQKPFSMKDLARKVKEVLSLTNTKQ